MPAIGYVSSGDWTEFEERFSAASAWLDRKNLEGELEFLRRCKTLGMMDQDNGPYRQRRLAELENWHQAVTAMESAVGEREVASAC